MSSILKKMYTVKILLFLETQCAFESCFNSSLFKMITKHDQHVFNTLVYVLFD